MPLKNWAGALLNEAARYIPQAQTLFTVQWGKVTQLVADKWKVLPRTQQVALEAGAGLGALIVGKRTIDFIFKDRFAPYRPPIAVNEAERIRYYNKRGLSADRRAVMTDFSSPVDLSKAVKRAHVIMQNLPKTKLKPTMGLVQQLHRNKTGHTYWGAAKSLRNLELFRTR